MTSRLFLIFLILAASPVYAETQISIGSKKFTESYVLGEIAKRLLEKAGFQVDHRQGMGGTAILWQALLHGDIALYPEYSGTISEEILKVTGDVGHEAMQAALRQFGVGMTDSLGFNDSYTLVMDRDTAARLNIKTISDLRDHPQLRAGPTPEFLGRKDGWQPLLAYYGLHFDYVRGIEHGLGYTALKNNQIDLKECYTTDAEIGEFSLVPLQDDRNFFPQYNALFLYRLDAPPKAIEALRRLEARIDNARMIELNAIAGQTKNYARAAAAFFGQDETQAAQGRGHRIRDLLADIPRLTVQHLKLVGISLLAAILVSVPLGIIASRPTLIGQLILGVSGVIQTIPSLALLALMIPLFGIGQMPAIIALFLYSLLPIIRNTAVGLQNIPLSLRQAAEALGLSPSVQMRMIYLPLALPSILAGIKISAIINIGNATLAGLIGGGGFGEPIQSGLQLNDNVTILQGAIPAAMLAFLAQFAFSKLDLVLIPKGLRLK